MAKVEKNAEKLDVGLELKAREGDMYCVLRMVVVDNSNSVKQKLK